MALGECTTHHNRMQRYELTYFLTAGHSEGALVVVCAEGRATRSTSAFTRPPHPFPGRQSLDISQGPPNGTKAAVAPIPLKLRFGKRPALRPPDSTIIRCSCHCSNSVVFVTGVASIGFCVASGLLGHRFVGSPMPRFNPARPGSIIHVGTSYTAEKCGKRGRTTDVASA
jgi:hypothetical protein